MRTFRESFTEDDRDQLVDDLCDALSLVEGVLEQKKNLSGAAVSAVKKAQSSISDAIDEVNDMEIEED